MEKNSKVEEWQSEDNKLYLRWQVKNKQTVFFETGRVSEVSHLSKFSVSDLGNSWFLMCGEICIELLTRTEMLAVAEFLGLTPVAE